MNRPRKARVEGEASEVKSERPSVGFRAAVKAFQAAHPDKWDELRLCPAQHALDVIAEHLERL